jgi:phage protein D
MPETFAPRWEIELETGERISPDLKRLVSSVTVEATVDGADELKIEALAWDSIAQSYRLSGSKLFALGNRVTVWGGYGRDLSCLQRFRLVRHEASYPDGGSPTLTIRGYSAEARLVDYTDARAYPLSKSDSDIAADLATFHGLSFTAFTIPSIPSRKAGRARVKSKGDTDWDFLRQLAVANGYGSPYIRYDHAKKSDVLYFRETDLALQDELAHFHYMPRLAGSTAASGTLVSFQPTLSLSGVPTHLEVTGWDSKAQQPIRVLVSIDRGSQESTILKGKSVVSSEYGFDPRIKSGTQLQIVALADGQEPTKKLVHTIAARVPGTVEDLAAWAKRWLVQRNAAFMQARGKVAGWEKLWVAQIHKFDGLASEHSGLWEVKSVTHSFDASGYWCDVDVDRVLEEANPPTETT